MRWYRKVFLALSCLLMIAAAWYLLSFGAAILCCEQLPPGTNSWQVEKLFFGLLPVLAGVGLFRATRRLWSKIFVSKFFRLVMGSIAVLITCVFDLVFYAAFHPIRNQPKPIWNPVSRVFNWGRGEITLPSGFTYQAQQGLDTYVGSFTSPDGRLKVSYDIGELAGAHAGMFDSVELTEGSRVFLAMTKTKVGVQPSEVSFPDSGCANFYLSSAGDKDGEVIQTIARSFQPRGWFPSRLYPLLPEAIRRDCRTFFRLPTSL